MFGTIRRHQNWLWFVVVAVVIISFLAFFDPSQRSGRSRSDQAGRAPEINGRAITPKVFGEAQREVRLLYFLNFRQWPEKDAERAQQINFDLENESYLRLFRVGKAVEAGIQVPDASVAELAKRLVGDPSQFDRFTKEMLIPNGLTADDFERFVRNDAMIQQLSSVVGAAGRLVTPAEAETLYRRDHQETAGEIVFFNLSNFMSKVVITNGALTNFHAQQAARYRTPEKVRVSYVEFAKTNFNAEAEKQLALVTNLTTQLREMYYKEGTNSFKDTNGAALSESAAMEKIKEVQRDRLALMMAARRANDFANKLYDQQPVLAANLDKLAAAEGLKVGVSMPFDLEDGPTNLFVSPRFARVAFSLNSSNNPVSVQPLEGENAMYIIALKETIPGHPDAFATVAAKVEDDYKRFNAFTIARTEATAFITKATNGLAQGKSFTELAQQSGLKAEVLPPISAATESVTNLDERLDVRQLKSVLFSLEAGKVSSYIPQQLGGYVVHSKGKVPMDEAKLKTELPKFTSELRYQKQNEIFSRWFSKQVEKSNLPLNNRTARKGAGAPPS